MSINEWCYLKLIALYHSILHEVLNQLQDCKQSNICFTSTSWCAYQQILVGIVRGIEHHTLNSVQLK